MKTKCPKCGASVSASIRDAVEAPPGSGGGTAWGSFHATCGHHDEIGAAVAGLVREKRAARWKPAPAQPDPNPPPAL